MSLVDFIKETHSALFSAVAPLTLKTLVILIEDALDKIDWPLKAADPSMGGPGSAFPTTEKLVMTHDCEKQSALDT